MLNFKCDFTYVASGNERLFTVCLLPDGNGKFPVVVMRSPYVDKYENEKEENIALDYLNENRAWWLSSIAGEEERAAATAFPISTSVRTVWLCRHGSGRRIFTTGKSF